MWDDGKFKEEYLKSWRGIGQGKRKRNIKKKVISELKTMDLEYLFYFVLFSSILFRRRK